MKSIRINKILPLFLFLFWALTLVHCTTKEAQGIYLITGSKINAIEQNVIADLKNDLAKISDIPITVISEGGTIPENGTLFLIGTTKSNALIKKLATTNIIELSSNNPGPRGGIWKKATLAEGQKAIILAGSDIQGLQYAIYDYSKEILGVDPLEYWTGKLPSKKNSVDLNNFEDRKIAPPKVPILCYFENDVDELANYRGKLLEYDWKSYTEMINALVRMRYNAIQLFDMLGRPEFFLRPEYQALHPDYKIDIAYLEKMIDYAQSKGMKVAIDFALGYQIHPMAADKATCWKTYKEDWINAWRYYLDKTPLKKTDIFMVRPRHQVWDWEYKSSCGEDKIAVFNEVYASFGKLVDEYKPNAEKVLVCYSDGMTMWNDGFRPPKDWTVCWSDDGFGDFKFQPNTTDNYNFGTYMHAGFWSNHTVHNPYPNKVETVMKGAFSNLNADKFCLVNGQNFRPFLLNLEAYSNVCNNPDSFTGDSFYQQWSTRYFGKEASTFAVEAFHKLNEAQFNRAGYVQHLWEIREAIAYLSNAPIERPGKPPVPYTYERVQNDFDNVLIREKLIDQAALAAEKGQQKVSEVNSVFYNDYVQLPIQLYKDLIKFEIQLHNMSKLKRAYEEHKDTQQLKTALNILKQTKVDLKTLYATRISGDKNPNWNGWYNPKIRRPNNGFPTAEMLMNIEANLTQLAN